MTADIRITDEPTKRLVQSHSRKGELPTQTARRMIQGFDLLWKCDSDHLAKQDIEVKEDKEASAA